MNTTTAHKGMNLPVILLLAALLQGLGVLILFAVEPLRKTRLTFEEQNVKALDDQARQRLKQHEEKLRTERARMPLTRQESGSLVEREKQKQRENILSRVEAMQSIRDDLALAESVMMEQVNDRSLRDVNLHYHALLHPLATQLVAHAKAQADQLMVDGTAVVASQAEAFLYRLQAERFTLLEPASFQRLRESHAQTRETQDKVIQSLDAAQLAYPDDAQRIREENHIEYLVNLMRDQISERIWDLETFDVATFNDPPTRDQPPPLEQIGAEEQANMAVEDLHHLAASLYEEIATLFSGARAADLALSDHRPLAQAFDRLSLPSHKTEFNAMSRPGSPGTMGELQAYREGLAQAARDVQRLWEQAQAMGAAGRAMAGLPQGPESTTPGGQPGGKGQPGALGTGPAGRRSSAARSSQGRYVDMTPFMLYRGPGEQGFGGTARGGQDSARSGGRSGFLDIGDHSEGTPESPPRLAEEDVIRQALPGRTFNRSSPRTGWLYLDTWYVIGPWENRSRLGFEQTWPPETLVDLDAEYTGKNGQSLIWRFHQTDNIRVKPPAETESATYYGYTEVYFEEAGDMLVAIASDDAAKVWINDLVIWEDDGLSPWRLDEGFRKVRFRQGYNTVLMRVDNGPINCTWSLLLCPPEVVPN